jgi:hypothetical protein
VRCFFVAPSFVFYVRCSVIDAAYSENWLEIDSASATDLPILTTLLSSLAFWSTLHPAAVPPCSSPVNQQLSPFSVASFGQGQPQVRQAAWTLVGSLIRVFKGLFRLLICMFAESLPLCIHFPLYIHSGCIRVRYASSVGYMCNLQASSAYTRSSTRMTDVFWHQANYQHP